MNILHTIHRAEQAGALLFTSHVKEKITIRQAVVLAAVKADPGASQTRLVEMTGIDRSTLADMARRCQRKGWLKRVRSRQDTRTYIITLTADGTKALAAATASAAKAEKALIERFPAVKHLANGGGVNA